ncbi:MAG: hypothetical protein CML03_01245 [Pseudooceanicola sp.]|nr:hypothetical protein [Pseudooceanicola sp.]
MTYQSFLNDPNDVQGLRVTAVPQGRIRRAQSISTSKVIFDKVFALSALILLAPVLAIIAGLIALSDGRPILFKQNRVGLHGRIFQCWKFRTMVLDAEKRLGDALDADPALRAEWIATRKLRNDPRINRLGHFLRKTSLDELPQFWNVLRGDMSMVGPRPVVMDELALYEHHAADYTAVQPGLTGAWQVSGRNNTTYAERVALDLDYIHNAGFWTDMRIVAKTLRVIIKREGAH